MQSFDVVYFWVGGTLRGSYSEISVGIGEDYRTVLDGVRSMGYYAVPGRKSIGCPDTAPTAEQLLAALQRVS